MNLGIRMRATDDFEDRFALALTGGRYVSGKHPKFVFSSELQRTQFERIRRQLRKEEEESSQ